MRSCDGLHSVHCFVFKFHMTSQMQRTSEWLLGGLKCHSFNKTIKTSWNTGIIHILTGPGMPLFAEMQFNIMQKKKRLKVNKLILYLPLLRQLK